MWKLKLDPIAYWGQLGALKNLVVIAICAVALLIWVKTSSNSSSGHNVARSFMEACSDLKGGERSDEYYFSANQFGLICSQIENKNDESEKGQLARASTPTPATSSLPLCEKGSMEMSLTDHESFRWVPKPARCTVQGVMIEALDPDNNFRQAFNKKFVKDPEDKTHVLPWLLATRKDFSQHRKKVFLDLGAKTFESSTQWFLQMYPLEFDEVYCFERREGIFRKPKGGRNGPFHADILSKIHVYEGRFVTSVDSLKRINITRFIVDELKLTAEDAVIVKMDIESSEWAILQHWAESPLMGSIVDELFVEMHYHHPTMEKHGPIWKESPQSREEATMLLHNLRANGIYAHAWP